MNTEFFKANGYQVFRNVLDKGLLAELKVFLSAEMDKSLNEIKAELGYEMMDDVYELLKHRDRLEALPGGIRQILAGHFPLDVRLSPKLWDIPRQKKLRDIVELLVGDSEIFMHMPATARFILPGNSYAAVPPHQDVSYNKHMTDFIVIWVPFVDIDEVCGGVTVYDNANIKQELKTKNQEDGFWLEGIDTTGLKSHHCDMKVGDVLALNKWVVHASTPNRSDIARISIDYRFFGGSDSSAKHCLDLQSYQVINP